MRQFCALAILLALSAGSSRAQTDQQPSRPAADWWQPTEKLNEQLPWWLQFDGSYRIRFEDQDSIGFKDVSDTHVLARLQIGAKLRPTRWLTFYGQGQDSRIYLNGVVTKSPPYQNTWDLHQLWVRLGDAENHHFAVEVGRQELSFGEERLVGPSPWFNAPRVFDAAVATVVFSGWRTDIFASSVVNSITGQLDHHEQGNPFYGIYEKITHLVPKATIEPYVFWRLAPVGYGPAYASGAKGHLDEKTFGFRWAGNLPAQLDYGAEIAGQNGTLGVDSLSAWAGHWVVGRSWSQLKLRPRVFGEYDYASGTANPTGTHIGTFDQLYPSGHDKFGLTDQVGWRNISDTRAGAEFKATEKLMLRGVFHDFWLANAHDGLYGATGAVLEKSLSGAGGRHVGEELDAQASYKLNTAVQLSGGFGHMFTGEFLRFTTPGKAYNYPFASATYTF